MTQGLRNINLSISVAGLVLSMLGLFNIFLSKYLEKGSRRFFAIIFAVLSSYVFFIYVRNATFYHVGYGWALLSRMAFFVQALMSSVLTVLITGFLLYQSGRVRWWKEPVFYISAALWCIYAAILIYAQFSKTIYYVDDRNGYHRGGFFPVLIVAPVLIMVINLIALGWNKDRLSRRQRRAFLVYAIVPLMAMIFQAAFFGIQFIVLGTVMAALLMYGYIAASQREEYYRQVTENEHLKINILLAQIQPHFLYNSLMTIKYLCGEDPKKAQEAISEFTAYLRNHMDSIMIDAPIPFLDEMKQVQEYLALQKLRFGEELQVEYELEYTDFMLPTLTLEPLVENAVVHGIRGSKEGSGTVTIRSRRLAGRIEVSVTDDGEGFEPEHYNKCSAHKGLSNASERLKKISGGEIRIDSKHGGGTTATIILPANGGDPKC